VRGRATGKWCKEGDSCILCTGKCFRGVTQAKVQAGHIHAVTLFTSRMALPVAA
jgi:hypothetical protein